MTDPVRVLAESVWEKWRAAVLSTTSYDGRHEAHPRLAALPVTVLSLDPGETTGYALVRKGLDGRWAVLACGAVMRGAVGARGAGAAALAGRDSVDRVAHAAEDPESPRSTQFDTESDSPRLPSPLPRCLHRGW